jgi:hypothetical protein
MASLQAGVFRQAIELTWGDRSSKTFPVCGGSSLSRGRTKGLSRDIPQAAASFVLTRPTAGQREKELKIMKFTKLLCFVLATATAMPLLAATKFVNHSAAGSGNGTSWANAWPNVSSIGWSSLAAGDVVCVAGGTYSGSITTAASGASGKPITIRRATAADTTCGSGTAGWNAAYDSQVVVSGIRLASNYVTIDGAVANGISMNLSNTSGSHTSIGVNAPTTGVVLRYIEVAGPCGTTACNQNGDARSIDLNNWNGSSYDLQANMTIQYSNLHGACTVLWTAHSTNLIIEHTRFADSADSTPGNPYCHPNIIAEQDATSATFRYNEVTNWQVEGIMACPNGSCSSSWAIYGNVWHDPMGGSYPRVLESQSNSNGPYLVYNNTFVNVSFAVANTANGGSFAPGTSGRNNIYWNSPSGVVPNSDYDLCNTSCDESNGQMYTETDLFAGYASKNYQLARATDAGQTLAAPYNIDYNGNPRGQDGVWDRGAYEFNGVGNQPSPPTSLTAAPR